MAYTSVQSGEITEGTQYYSGKLPLGDYNFYVQYDATTATVVTRCDLPSGIRAATQRQFPGSELAQWRVEANGNEASVYAVIKSKESGINYITLVADGDVLKDWKGGIAGYRCSVAPKLALSNQGDTIDVTRYQSQYYAANYTGIIYTLSRPTGNTDGSTSWVVNIGNAFRPQGLNNYDAMEGVPIPESTINPEGEEPGKKGQDGEFLVARFAINLGDAGGYPGGGGGWTKPGDWNPEPTTTLHLTINGALSGRHNDPLHDPSYSYVPADNTAEAGYGCGGDGGHGGGGGGGASTVIAEQFATNKANSKVIVATSKRHGYGSGGSKGAKGGNGCILIYY